MCDVNEVISTCPLLAVCIVSVCEVTGERPESAGEPVLVKNTNCDMEVSAEAKRIMVVALGKLYTSRTQRGGLRLHRSLLLSLVMKSARDMYHEAQAAAETVPPGGEQQHPAAEQTQCAGGPVELGSSPPELPRDAHGGAEDKENRWPGVPGQHSRKRRGKAAAEPDFLPCKKAKLEKAVAPQQLSVNSFMEYVSCGGEVGAPPSAVPLHRAVAAC